MSRRANCYRVGSGERIILASVGSNMKNFIGGHNFLGLVNFLDKLGSVIFRVGRSNFMLSSVPNKFFIVSSSGRFVYGFE